MIDVEAREQRVFNLREPVRNASGFEDKFRSCAVDLRGGLVRLIGQGRTFNRVQTQIVLQPDDVDALVETSSKRQTGWTVPQIVLL